MLTRLPSRDELKAERCARSLSTFIRESWPILEPATPYVHGWHIDVVCEHLEAVRSGELVRLIINIPPRAMKSITVAVCWPAWEWLTAPHTRWLFASYAANLSIRDSLKCRRLIESPGGREEGTLFERLGYRGVLGLLAGEPWELTGDQNAKTRFENTRTGFRLATSVGGSATGEGGDRVVCLDGDSLITTSAGRLPIRDIVERRLPVRVLGSSGSWQEIAEYERGPGRPMIEITTADGAALRCTEDHPIYLEGHGWRPARAVMSLYGDLHMRRLREPLRASASARSTRQDGPVLLPRLLRQVRAAASQPRLDRRQGDGGVRALRNALPLEAIGGEAASLLLTCVPVPGRTREAPSGVRAMRGLVHPPAAGSDVLLAGLRRGRASHDGARRRERPVPAWWLADGIHDRLHGEASGDDPGARPQPLRRLRPGELGASGAPHRRLEGQSRPDQPRDGLHPLPPKGPHEDRHQRDLDEPVRIIAVRRVETPDAVYNLRVEPDHDYYAAGLLVHNCDDPVNPEQARSEAERNAANVWWDETMTTRLNNAQAAMVVVMQRLHEEDLTGHLIAKGGWHHLCLPAEYEPSHPFVCPENFVLPERSYPVQGADGEVEEVTIPGGRVLQGDRRTRAGELLEPVRLGRGRLDELLRELLAYGYAGQMQQRPAPAEGGMFKRGDFRDWWLEEAGGAVYAVLNTDEGLRRYDYGHCTRFKTIDAAGSERESADFTVIGLWAITPDAHLLLERIDRQQFDELDVPGFIQRSIMEHPGVVPYIERFGFGSGYIKQLLARGHVVGKLEADRDKVTRAIPAVVLCQQHRLFFMRRQDARWRDVYEEELLVFPNGRNDDQVDVTSYAARQLTVLYSGGKTRTIRNDQPKRKPLTAGVMGMQR